MKLEVSRRQVGASGTTKITRVEEGLNPLFSHLLGQPFESRPKEIRTEIGLNPQRIAIFPSTTNRFLHVLVQFGVIRDGHILSVPFHALTGALCHDAQ